MGWRKEISERHPAKYVICLAPHTSNWDFLLGLCYAKAEGISSRFLMKREWFFWPLGVLFKRLGGIPVWRDKHSSMTDNLADYLKKEERCVLCVTPEGTRSLNPDWKKGFYFIALKVSWSGFTSYSDTAMHSAKSCSHTLLIICLSSLLFAIIAPLSFNDVIFCMSKIGKISLSRKLMPKIISFLASFFHYLKENG